MNKKKKLRVLIVQLVLMFAAILALVIWIANEKKEVTIYDYARSIEYNEKANYAITAADIKEATILAADVKDTYIQNKDEVIGRYITTSVYKDEHISKKELSKDPTYNDKNAVSELADFRKIYLDINFKSAFAGDIEAGDTVDLMFTDNGSGMPTERVSSLAGTQNGVNYVQSRIFMQNIPVYQVYKNGSVYKKVETDPATLGKFQGENSMSGDPNAQQSAGAPDQVALTVTAKQYEEISSRMQMGTVSLVSRFDESQDVDTNGYVVVKGNAANIYAGEGNLEYDTGITSEVSETASAVETKLPALYSFIKDLGKISMTDDQKQRYYSVYTRYSELMEASQGTEWEINNPDSITMEMLQNSIDTSNEDAVNAFMIFKSDLDKLAKELRGNNVLLPW